MRMGLLEKLDDKADKIGVTDLAPEQDNSFNPTAEQRLEELKARVRVIEGKLKNKGPVLETRIKRLEDILQKKGPELEYRIKRLEGLSNTEHRYSPFHPGYPPYSPTF